MFNVFWTMWVYLQWWTGTVSSKSTPCCRKMSNGLLGGLLVVIPALRYWNFIKRAVFIARNAWNNWKLWFLSQVFKLEWLYFGQCVDTMCNKYPYSNTPFLSFPHSCSLSLSHKHTYFHCVLHSFSVYFSSYYFYIYMHCLRLVTCIIKQLLASSYFLD